MTFKAVIARTNSKPFMIAGAVALAGIVAAMLSASREPQPAIAQFAKLIQPPVFDERWDDSSVFDSPLLKKQDRLTVPVMAQGVPLGTERGVVPPTKLPAVTVPPKADEKPISRRKQRERNVCTRHNMRKVTTRGGRSWRCRR